MIINEKENVRKKTFSFFINNNNYTESFYSFSSYTKADCLPIPTENFSPLSPD